MGEKKVNLDALNGDSRLARVVREMIDEEKTEYRMKDGRRVYRRDDGFYVTEKE